MVHGYQYTDGNQTVDGRWNYTWDAENRLVRMVANTAVGPQQRIDCGYDAKGRRISKKVWSNTAGTGSPATYNRFMYDGWNLLAELDGNNTNAIVRSYIWGSDLSGSMQGAGGVGGLLMINDPTTVANHFVAYDGNGNVASTATYEYGPFGEPIRSSGAISKTNPYRFSTKYQDNETDLLYYGYRYYCQSTGKWINRDTSGETGGLGLYLNSRNNLVDSLDLFGISADYTVLASACRLIVNVKARFVGHDNPALDHPAFKWDKGVHSSESWKTEAKKVSENYFNGLPYKCKGSKTCPCADGYSVNFNLDWGQFGCPINVYLGNIGDGLDVAHVRNDEMYVSFAHLLPTVHPYKGKTYSQITFVHEMGHLAFRLGDTYNQDPIDNPGALMSFGMDFLKGDFDSLFCKKIGSEYEAESK